MTDLPRPLFIDTSALFARFNARDARHKASAELFEEVRRGDATFGPLYTSDAVLTELATLLDRKVHHRAAVTALRVTRSSSSLRVLHFDEEAFDAACRSFERYDDQSISLVDHASAALTERHDIRHIFSFDDDFRALGLEVVPGE